MIMNVDELCMPPGCQRRNKVLIFERSVISPESVTIFVFSQWAEADEKESSAL